MRKISITLLIMLSIYATNAQDFPWSQRMTATVLKFWPDTATSAKWAYEQGVFMKGVEGVWLQTGDKKYIDYIKKYLDNLIAEDGTINGYKEQDYNIDNILLGRQVLMLYQKFGEAKYLKALQTLRHQLQNQPRTNEGGFWHKKRYPFQMWLDGLYMGEPFYAEYAVAFKEEKNFDDIAKQFIYMEKHARDAKTGLLYHGWDESRKERWSNPVTGLSKNFWGRAEGWYVMALVDVLDNMPSNHPDRKTLLAILNRTITGVVNYQDKQSGLWYQVLDKANEKGNYLESSASCMFVYALAKGVRKGYLPKKYLPVAERAYKGIINKFIEVDADGQVNLNGTVSVAGLGGTPYRDGSYQYYLSEKVVQNDAKGVGAFIQASVEVEKMAAKK